MRAATCRRSAPSLSSNVVTRVTVTCRLRAGLALLVCLAGGLLLSGCGGPTRSAAAFCSTLHSEKQAILGQFNASSSSGGSPNSLMGALSGLGASVQAISELRTYFHKLADVAPSPIEDDASIVAQSYDEQMNGMGQAMSNPIAGAFGALIQGATYSGQLDAMNRFALQNCHESV